MIETTRTKLIATATRLLDIIYGMQLLAYGVSVAEKETERRNLTDLRHLSKNALRDRIDQLRKHIASTRKRLGITAPDVLFVRFVEKYENRPDKRAFPMIDLPHLFQLFPKLSEDRFLMNLPRHARLYIHDDLPSSNPREVNWFVLETSIYEEMCALFNLAKGTYHLLDYDTASKAHVKTANALYHSTVNLSYYFVEAFLNGMSFELLISRPNLTPKQRMRLSEWDEEGKRKRPLSLREKLLEYPRIMADIKHPPLQENNCPEMAVILQSAKVLRDALSHPSPERDHDTLIAEKERALISIDLAKVEEIVDSAVMLVRKLEKELKGDDSMIPWLRSRGTDGMFEEAVFD